MTSDTSEPTIDERIAAFRAELALLGVPADRVLRQAANYRVWLLLHEGSYAEKYRHACLTEARSANNAQRKQ